MRVFRPVLRPRPAPGSGAATDQPDDGSQLTAYERAAATLARASRPIAIGSASVTGAAPFGRIDLARLTAAPPLHRPTVTGAGAGRGAEHIGGAMSPPAADTMALSDGTRISFSAVEEIPLLEYA